MKTHKGTKKRIKVTAKKRFLAQGGGKSHLLGKKSRARKNRLTKFREVTHTKTKRIARLLGI